MRSPGLRRPPSVVMQVLAHGQITDVYRLALAVHHQGMLVSFDSCINTQVVQGGQDVLHLIRSSP